MISLFMCRKAEVDARALKRSSVINNVKKKNKDSFKKKEKTYIGGIIATIFLYSSFGDANHHTHENHEPIHNVPSHIDLANAEENPLMLDATQAQMMDENQERMMDEFLGIDREHDRTSMHPMPLQDFMQARLTDSDTGTGTIDSFQETPNGSINRRSSQEGIHRSVSTRVHFSTTSPFKDSLKSPDLDHLQQSMHIALSPACPARILVLDGGGVRGLMELAFLEKLERATGLKTAQMFHMIGGTSVGGKIAVLLSAIDPVTQEARYSASELKRIFLKKYDDMFSMKFKTLFGLFGEKYKTTPILKMIDSLVGDQLFADTIIPAFAVAYDLTTNSEDKLKVFSSEKDVKVKMKDVILATTAAPSYFKSHKIGDNEYADGGLILNNPTVVAINEAHKHFENATEYVLVSLGTGVFPDIKHKVSLRHRSIVTIASEVPSFFLYGQNNAAREGLQYRNNIVPFRFTPVIHGKKIDMDDVSKESISRMLNAVDRLWDNEAEDIRKLLDVLPHIHQDISA